MMKIAFIQHSYHHLTHSTSFFLKILKKYNLEVDIYFEDPEKYQLDLAPILEKYDRIIYGSKLEISLTQSFKKKLKIKTSFMYLCLTVLDILKFIIFGIFLQKVKILNFSRILHEKLIDYDFRNAYFQYYPNPYNYNYKPIKEQKGFFWLRFPSEISLQDIKN